jgi:hypothetical protein
MMDQMGGQEMEQGEGGGMVQCPCCGQGQVPPEVAEKVMQAMEPQPDTDDAASQLAAAMGPPQAQGPMRRG